MDRGLIKDNLVQRIPQNSRVGVNSMRRPFWYSTANYYILAVAIAVAIFFIVWGLLNNIAGETPWITAGVISSFFLIFTVILREFILRRNQQKHFAQRQMDFHLQRAYRQQHSNENSDKLTIEQNSLLIKKIEEKSRSARVLGKDAEAHFEVFEMCNAYLQRNESELENIIVSSPRFPVLRKSRQKIEDLHKFHVLQWTSLESQNLIKEANFKSSINEKLENAQRALNVLFSGLQFYPNDESLTESIKVVKEFTVTVKVSHWMEQAQRSAFKENYKRAINHYRDALFFLARENERTNEHEEIAEHINQEIEKLRELEKNSSIKKKLSPNKK